MDRRLLFPAIAASAIAQQTSPNTAEAEKALRARVQQFYQLEVDKKFRQAEALVAEDTKDYFYNGGRPDIQSFAVEKVELSERNEHARVTIRAKAAMIAPGMTGIVVEVPIVSTWKIENGIWSWYVDQSGSLETPFGKVRSGTESAGAPAPRLPGIPDVASLKNQVTVDRTEVVLSDAAPVQTVSLSNHLTGGVTIEVQSSNVEGLVVELDKKQLGGQQQATISFHAKPGAKPSGKVGIDVQPLGQHFEIAVSSK